jgi:zinc transporter ZupT
MLLLFVILTFVSTLLGGIVGIKYKDKLHLILGFTAGVLLAVVAFDIFPEIIRLVNKLQITPSRPMIGLVIGFLTFHILEKLLLIHYSQEESYKSHKHPSIGILSASALSAHPFLDGLGIGLAFQVSPSVGMVVAMAVIAHDFSDGLNTVSLMMLQQNTFRRTVIFLVIDAAAPLLGAASTLFFTLSETALLLYLGFFAGFLLYIGASEILPEAHHEHPSAVTIAMTVFGVALMFVISRVL